MKNTSKTTKEQNTKPAKARREARAKAADAAADTETGDRLPASLDELKATKGGLVSFLFLSGKDKDAIAKELKTAFKLTEIQAVKITRRITGRARFFQRAFALTSAK